MIIANGEKGYLLKHVLQDHRLKSGVYCFGSPISSEYGNSEKFESAFNELKELVDLSNNLKLPLHYASSMAVLLNDNNDQYKIHKQQCEEYIVNNCKQYLIYRINRVYSKDRSKGLLKKLRNNEVPLQDYDKEVEFSTLEDFLDWFFINRNYNKIVNHTVNTQRLSIHKIREMFVEY